MDFWSRLEGVRSRHNVLDHPFYQRWAAGELTLDELAYYSGEYYHAVRGLADASARVAALADGELGEQLARHAAEERDHVEMWADFAEAVGADRETLGAGGREESLACREQWGAAGADFLSGLVTLYSIESGQPEISETKRRGLVDHYQMNEGPATAYFDLHAELDKEHAASARALIEQRLAGADEDGLLETAERVFSANWRLLDGVEVENRRRAAAETR